MNNPHAKVLLGPTIVVGDLHGKLAIAKKVMADFSDCNIVFLGDFLDSFDASIGDQIELLDLVLDAAANNPSIVALIGNHELSYLVDFYRASGWKALTQLEVDARAYRMTEHLIYAIEVEGFLLTHAGVSLNWLPKYDIDNLVEYINAVDTDELYAIGYARGGHSRCGGPLWCDTWAEFKPIEGVKQVFGHTAARLPWHGPGIVGLIRVDGTENYNVDCLDRTLEVLEIHDGKARIISLE